MVRETGAETETNMCVWRGTCSDKHLWKYSCKQIQRQCMQMYKHMWKHAVKRHTCAEACAPGDERRERYGKCKDL